MVYGVSRIALPGCELGGELRAGATAEFLAGPENRLVVPVLQRLMSGEDFAAAARLFNPLVLLGPTGSGKSHLARGIARHWSARLDESEVAYFTAIDFARQLRAAREDDQLDAFRQRVSALELLIVEDLHKLPVRTFVQRELRDAIDELVNAGALVVFTTQQPPAVMADWDTGLRDRLASGLTVRLQNPGPEARLELLRQVADERASSITDEQLEQLAAHIEGPVPQLERAIAEQELLTTDSPLCVDRRPKIRLKQIITVVARYFSITQAALCSSARRKSLVYARGVTVYLARALTDQSYAQIGHALGRRDHTTVMHAERTIEKRLTSDATTQQDIEELKRILTAV